VPTSEVFEGWPSSSTEANRIIVDKASLTLEAFSCPWLLKKSIFTPMLVPGNLQIPRNINSY